MKKILFICIFITGVMNINAQDDWCGTIPTDFKVVGDPMPQINQSVTMESFHDKPPLVVKVHFWDVNGNDGNNNFGLEELQMLEAVAQLNKDYNAFNIFFKYDGVTDFNAQEFQDINFGFGQGEEVDFLDYQLVNDLYDIGTINIYSVFNITGGVAAYQSYESTNGIFGTIVSEYVFIGGEPTYVLTHEVGHFFKLLHVFDCGSFDTQCENVTRDVNNTDCYNADVAGDYVIDTNATPKNMSWNTSDCTYNPSWEADECGVFYNTDGLEPEVKNYMSYAHGCQSVFTPGQVARMRHWINYYNDHSYITVIKTHPVSILYEPYKGEYYFAGPLPVDEGGHLNPPRFQYGFDYVFYDTSQADVYNQPSAYEDTSFWYGSVVQSYDINHNTPIEHTNHTAFKILQVDTNYPRMCYNNYNRAPSGGTIIKFLEGVPNGNVTITAQDSLQINNPDFYQDLDSGLYNIQKSYNDGTTDENLILKENN